MRYGVLRAHPLPAPDNGLPMRLTTLLLILLVTSPCHGDEVLRIAVAANFRATLEHINPEFERDNNIRLSLSSASTGVLATQIRHGAPFDVFFSADSQTPATLRSVTSMLPPECYAVGKLALVGGNGNLDQLALPELSVAIANPVTAPYGRAAQAVLSRDEFASGSTRKLVRGNNVVQAYQFWHTGGTNLALLAQSIAPREATPVPSDWHAPLEQHLLILKKSKRLDRYLNWLRSDRVRSVITSAGYDPCP
ncbi:MAG: molybdate transport system substrate-binding protein [Bacteroidia bacterium]